MTPQDDLSEELLRLLRMKDSANVALAFQISHKKPKLYPYFYEQVGKVLYAFVLHDYRKSFRKCDMLPHFAQLPTLQGIIENFIKKSIKAKIGIWQTIQHISESMYFLPDCDFGLLNVNTIRVDIEKPTTLSSKLRGVIAARIDVAKKASFDADIECKHFTIEGKGVVLLPHVKMYELYVANCPYLNEDSFDNVQFYENDNLYISITKSNLLNGQGLARLINRALEADNNVHITHKNVPLFKYQHYYCHFYGAIYPKRKYQVYINDVPLAHC